MGAFGFLGGVSGFVLAVLACASMLFSVKFHVGMREVRMLLVRVYGERNFARRRQLFPYTFFCPVLRAVCVLVLTRCVVSSSSRVILG